MDGIEGWIPSLVAAGALGLVWWNFKTSKSELTEKVKLLEESNEGFLTKEKHELMCENSTLKVNAHISTELKKVDTTINKMKDDLFNQLRNVEKLIRNGGKDEA